MERRAHLASAARYCGLTVAWNAIAGTGAIAIAFASGSSALAGFGFDAAIDAAASAVLVWRFRAELAGREPPERVERVATRTIGVTLVVVAVSLAAQSVRSLLAGTDAEGTWAGVALALASAAVLPGLAFVKGRLARELSSTALRGDAALTAAGAALALVALAGIALDGATGVAWADPAAALVIAAFLLDQGRRTLAAPSAQSTKR